MHNLHRSSILLSALLVLAFATPHQAYGANAFTDFFKSLGSATKDAFNDGDTRRRGTSGNSPTQLNTPKAAPRKVKVADPKLRNTQAALNRIGFNAGKPDGIYGKRTGQAIGQFQTSIGQPVTGKLSGEQRDILMARARDAKKVATSASTSGAQNAQGLNSPDTNLKDALPTPGQQSYFDADEPEDETLPPTPSNAN